MSDLISRQAAIDICRAPHMRNADCSDFEMAIMMLPPANNSEIPNSSDTISRAKAIDGKICIRRSNGVEIYDDYAVPVEYLKQLPSTRPERIRGHWVNGRCDKCNEHAPFWAMASTYYESNFCPDCGADMRGEQDG